MEELEDGDIMIIHNSYDKREYKEKLIEESLININ